MSLETIQLNNQGFKLVINVKDPSGAIRDLTDATNLKIKIKSVLSKVGKEFVAAFEGSPTLGVLSYTFVDGDIDALGVWKAQAYYEQGAWKGHTHPEEAFYVEGNLA